MLRHARARPDGIALVTEDADGASHTVTFGALAQQASGFAGRLRGIGLQPGDRVVVLVRPSAELYALLLGLFAGGFVAVVVDGTFGRHRLGRALMDARPAAVVGERKLRVLRLVVPALRRLRWLDADAPAPGVAGGRQASDAAAGDLHGPVAAAHPEAPAVISFTSGTTGRAKGAVRSHRIMIDQHLALRAVFPDRPDEVGLTLFPLVGLHHLMCGHTVVLPPRSRRSHPPEPDALARRIEAHRVTAVSAAPAALDALVAHLGEEGRRLGGVRAVLSGGAPVAPHLCARVLRSFPDAEGLVAYGATEAEPVARVAMAEVATRPGRGYLVGAPVPLVEVELVDLPHPLPRLGPERLAPYRVTPGTYGEVVVRGGPVVRAYFENPDAEAATKLRAPDGSVWHRTGDVARRDAEGRLWLGGRRGDEVPHHGRTVQPYEVEVAAEGVPGVRRAAFVAHRRAPHGELLLELQPGQGDDAVRGASAVLRERGLADVPVHRMRRLPVDARHRSKVDRAAVRRKRERGNGLQWPQEWGWRRG